MSQGLPAVWRLVCSRSTLRSVLGRRCNDALGASTSYCLLACLTASSPKAIKVAICGKRARYSIEEHLSRDITNRSSNMPQSATTLNCHFVVVYPKALHSSGPLSRRHAQSHSARVLAHVTYYPRPAEAAAAAAVLIRLATAICDHQAYVRGSIRTRARARANQASNLVHVTTLERSRSRLRNNPRQDIASSSTSTSHSGSHNHMRKNEPQPLHESFPSPRLVCTFLPTVVNQ
jgi:hypothetical protein